jgi:hypothetical protein
MDKVFGSDYRITIRDDTQCFITVKDNVYAMSLLTTVDTAPTTVPVHVINMNSPLAFIPEPIIDFTLISAAFTSTMKSGDLVVLIYNKPCCVGFIGALDPSAHAATIHPIAVNMSRGAIIFIDSLPEVPDAECLYILKSSNSAYAYWDSAWHIVGTDVTEFQKALDIHARNQALHVSTLDRKRWSSGGNFVGIFDKYVDFLESDAYDKAQVGDFALLRHALENDNVAIYSVTSINDGIPQWYKAHLWDNAGGKYAGSFSAYNLLPETANPGDFALVGNDFYIMAAKWELSHALQVRDFEAQPIQANEINPALLMPPNAYEHLFNFNFSKTAIIKYQELFTANNTGPTNLLEYIYHGKVPRWASIRLSVRDEQVALFDRHTELYIRVFGKTADGASQILGEWHVLGEVSVMNTYWLYPQTKTTSMFLMLPEMTITAGLYEPYTNTWPAYKHADTGSHELKGSFELLMHSA